MQWCIENKDTRPMRAIPDKYTTAVYSMRAGFSVKELSEILGVDARRAGQSVDPAVEKIARLWMCNPTKTMELVLDRVHTLRRARQYAMSEDEIEERIRAATGRMNTRHREASDYATGRKRHHSDVPI